MTDPEVRYQHKSVRTVRGTEALVRKKQEKDGWEFVDQNTATLQSTLNFRRVKPPIPWLKIGLGAAAAVVLATIVGVGALLEDDNEKPAQQARSSPSASKPAPAPAPTANITNTTVDELLDRMNAGGSKTGDRYRVTGELFQSDLWGTGASGDYIVMLKAKGGAQDLSVFADESKADKWKDGTKVEMVLKAVEATIDGETTDGWLRVEAAKTLSGGTSAEAKESAAKQKLFDAVAAYGAGSTFINSVEPGFSGDWIYVNLNPGLVASGPLQAKTTIKTINGEIMDIVEGIGGATPLLKYFLAGDAVAQNRYIMDPWDVKFEGFLDD